MENFDPIVIHTQEDYETLYKFIEDTLPNILEIGIDYFITESKGVFEYFEVNEQFKFVLEDILDYHINGIKTKEIVKESPKQKDLIKKKFILNPKKVVTISNISFNIY